MEEGPHTPMFSVGEDWVFLAILGIIVATISFCMDYLILVCNQVREHAHCTGRWE
jgi:hypothetical protein